MIYFKFELLEKIDECFGRIKLENLTNSLGLFKELDINFIFISYKK